MTVSSTESRVEYAGNDVTVAFSFPYYFLLSGDLKVYIRDAEDTETLQVEDTDYTVTGAGEAAGGTVTMTTAPATGETLVIYRDPATTQTLDLRENDSSPAEAKEAALDRLAMICQRLIDLIDRCVKLSNAFPDASFDPTLPATIGADKYLVTNSAGDGLSLVDLTTSGTYADPVTTQGDIIRGSATGIQERLALGSANTLLGVNAAADNVEYRQAVAADIATDAITTAKIIDDAVTLAKMAPGTDGNLITYDANGDPAAVATGNALQVLTSNGAGAAPTFQTPIFSEAYESSQQTITAAGSLTLAHGLSSTPKLYTAVLVCTDASGEHNYAQNDEVTISINIGDDGTGSNKGVVIIPDSTNLNVRYSSGTNTFQVLDKTAGTLQVITNTKWAMVFRAWA